MLSLEILEMKHREYLIFDRVGVICGIKENSPEETKKAYAKLLEYNAYCEENEIDF